MDAASAPLVAMAATAPIQTSSGAPKRAAMVAAVICPTSPHSEKKIAAKETMAARAERPSFSEDVRSTGLRQSVMAIPMKLSAGERGDQRTAAVSRWRCPPQRPPPS